MITSRKVLNKKNVLYYILSGLIYLYFSSGFFNHIFKTFLNLFSSLLPYNFNYVNPWSFPNFKSLAINFHRTKSEWGILFPPRLIFIRGQGQ